MTEPTRLPPTDPPVLDGGVPQPSGRTSGLGGFARLLDRVVASVIRHRALTLVGLVCVTALAVQASRSLRVDFTTQELFASGDPEIETLRAFKDRWGHDDLMLLCLVESRDVFAPQVLGLVQTLSRSLARLPHVARLRSLATVPALGQTEDGALDTRPLLDGLTGKNAASLEDLRRRTLDNPLLSGRLVSRDSTIAAVAMDLEPRVQRAREVSAAVADVEAVLAKTPLPDGVRLHLLGVPKVRVDAVDQIVRDQIRFMPTGALLTGLFLLFFYRRLRAVILPMTAVYLSTGYTVAFMAATNQPIDILSNVLPLLVMVYGLADVVHMMGRIQEENAVQPDRVLAIRVAVRQLALACLMTSATTAVGFGSLVTAHMDILRRFGLLAAAGVMIAWATAMVIVPLGASLGQGLDLGPSRTRGPSLALDHLLGRIARFTTRRPRSILLVAILLGVGCLGLGLSVEVNNYLLGVYFDGHPTARATRLAEEKLEGVVTLQIVLHPKSKLFTEPKILHTLNEISRWLEKQPGVGSTVSPATYVEELHRAVVGQRRIPETAEGVAQLLLMAEGETGLEQVLSLDQTQARIEVRLHDIGARAYLDLARVLDLRLAAALHPLGVRTHVTGSSLVAYRGINRVVTDMLSSLLVAFLIIAFMMALIFRSLRLGLISMVPNVIPLAVGLGFMRLTGMRLEPVTVIIFSIALGIAVDDTIHYIMRYTEERNAGAGPEDACRRTLSTTGRSMVFTSLLLIVGFSVTLSSGFPGTVRFGTLGIVILLSALIADLFLTPACLLWLHRTRPPRASAPSGASDP